MSDSKYNADEWQKPPKGVMWPTQKRREELLRLARNIGLGNVNKKELAAEMGISKAQIFRDITKIVADGVPRDELQRAKFNIDQALVKGLEMAHTDLLKAKDPSERARVLNALSKVSDSYTEFLERFGIKKVEHGSLPGSITINWGKDPDKKEEDEEAE